MKGIVFTEFIELVENSFGYQIAQKIITENVLESGGNYTSVGTYKHEEMLMLLNSLSKETKIEIQELLYIYGKHFFDVLLKSYPAFFEKQKSCFGFLYSVDNYIHPEVLKLYPEAELPKFEAKLISDKELHLKYQSIRKMGAFAKGLIERTINYYGNKHSLHVDENSLYSSTTTFILKEL